MSTYVFLQVPFLSFSQFVSNIVRSQYAFIHSAVELFQTLKMLSVSRKNPPLA